MAKKVDGFENITARIPKSLSDFMDEVKWNFKDTRAGLTRRVLHEWAEAHGYDQWRAEHTTPDAPDSDAA